MVNAALAEITAGEEFVIGNWLVQPRLGRISASAQSFHLEPKAMDVLVVLARHAGAVVSKNDLLAQVWPDVFVTEHVLTRIVSQLRQVFGTAGIIETIPRRGYRLCPEVRPATPVVHAIAVLPFLNLSGDPEREYFCDGMTEALLTTLAQLARLRVISRTSVMRYKNLARSVPEIAAELGVDALLEGSVLYEGDRVRVTVQLIHAASDRHLWAKSYERPLGEVIGIQDEIAGAVAAELRVSFVAEAPATRSKRLPRPDAFDAYLRGLFCHHQATEEGLRRSIAHMEQAVALDPGYALAHAALANSYALLASPVVEAIAPAVANARMRPAVLRALELDPDLAEAHFLVGWMNVYYEWDWAAAEAAYERALRLNPSYALAYAGLGTVYETLGRHDAASRAWAQACELDPLSLLYHTLLGWTLVLGGDGTQAVQQLQRTLNLDPGYWFAREVFALALLQVGRDEEAIQEAEAAVRLCGDVFPKGVLGHIYYRTGRTDAGRRLLAELDELARTRYVSPVLRGFIAACEGGLDVALHCMQEGFAVRDPAMIWLKSFETLWGLPLRNEPRYRALLSEMHLSLD